MQAVVPSHSYESYDSQVSYQSIGSYVLGLRSDEEQKEHL